MVFLRTGPVKSQNEVSICLRVSGDGNGSLTFLFDYTSLGEHMYD